MMMTATNNKRVDPIRAFELRCQARAYLFAAGDLELHDAVDGLQLDAEIGGLVDTYGQDVIQRAMAEAFLRRAA
jgi:hypothetical protein